MRTTKKLSKMLVLGMAAMVSAFGLLVMGCEEPLPTFSISLYGEPKVGETVTARFSVDGESKENRKVLYALYDDANCENASSPYNTDYEEMDGIRYQTPYYTKKDYSEPPEWVISSSAEGKWIRAATFYVAGTGIYSKYNGYYYSNVIGPVEAGEEEQLMTISPITAIVAKGASKAFTVTINEVVVNSSDIAWTVTPSTGGSTIVGSGHSISGSKTTQTRTLNVANGESASSLTVTATYNGQSTSATVAVTTAP
ncbi:hypothetical protein FACS1894102_7620 [Spirochaetia bacterium]|nr:hypothetical protein FACS1894102_7620 [Spirochaetia bacterium]